MRFCLTTQISIGEAMTRSIIAISVAMTTDLDRAILGSLVRSWRKVRTQDVVESRVGWRKCFFCRVIVVVHSKL